MKAAINQLCSLTTSVSHGPPGGDEAGLLGSGTGLYETTPDPSQFASQPEAAQAVVERDKAVATTIAEAALAGFSVYVVEGGFIACKWGWSRTFADLTSLRQWLGRCTGGTQ